MGRGSVAAVASVALAACCLSPVAELADGGASRAAHSGAGGSGTTGNSGTGGGSSGAGASSGAAGGSSSAGASSTGGRSSTAAHVPAVVMIVQDLSGSMCQPINSTSPGGTSCLATEGKVTAGYCSNCFPGVGTCIDPVNCASQMGQASTALTAVLTDIHPTTGQLNLGLAAFPASGDTLCGLGTIRVPIGDAVTTLPQIVAFYQSAEPSGGAPMAATLAVAAQDPALTNPNPAVKKIILLVTNGWPNCASTSPCTTEPWSNGQVYACASPAEVAATGVQAMPPPDCSCSFGTCATTATPADCCPATPSVNAAFYCLDDQATADELGNLYYAQNITTYVVDVGIGYGTNATVLNELAQAGYGSSPPFLASSPAPLEALLENLIGGG